MTEKIVVRSEVEKQALQMVLMSAILSVRWDWSYWFRAWKRRKRAAILENLQMMHDCIVVESPPCYARYWREKAEDISDENDSNR